LILYRYQFLDILSIYQNINGVGLLQLSAEALESGSGACLFPASLWKGRWQSYVYLLLSVLKASPPVWFRPKPISGPHLKLAPQLTVRSFPRTRPPPTHTNTHTFRSTPTPLAMIYQWVLFLQVSDLFLLRWLWYINESYFYMPSVFNNNIDTQYCSYIWTFCHLDRIYLCVYIVDFSLINYQKWGAIY